MEIREWVEAKFGGPESKLFLELGAHDGNDTAWMAAIPGVTMHAFEPDPRNIVPPMPNVIVHRKAIAAHDGRCPFILSATRRGAAYSKSSSIRSPKGHLTRMPDILFGGTIEVDCISLDTFTRATGIERVDFIWADIQGAEGDMIAGGQETLSRTRYIYTEYSETEEYEGQPKLKQILDMLPNYAIVERWPWDVLLENTVLVPH